MLTVPVGDMVVSIHFSDEEDLILIGFPKPMLAPAERVLNSTAPASDVMVILGGLIV